jgi:two-component system CheB/CheR fusion protein
MRDLRARHPIRGIALTGHGRDEDIRNSTAAGFHAHLTKPVNLPHLKHLLHTLT